MIRFQKRAQVKNGKLSEATELSRKAIQHVNISTPRIL
jgi:hypothetical protein